MSAAPSLRSRLSQVVLALLLWVAVTSAHAEGIHIKSAELVPAEQGYGVDATFEIVLPATLEDALLRGTTLTFVTEFELTRPRWWTLHLWNATISEFRTSHRLSYNALTRQFRLGSGALHQSFDTVGEALAVLGRVRYSPAVKHEDVERGDVYLAALRLRLDVSQLPKPLQINALGSRDWNLGSDWYRWTFKP